MMEFSCPLPITDYKNVLLAHGGGGKLSRQLIETIFLPLFGNPLLNELHDGATFEAGGGTRLAFSTDSYVIHPIFFPGGDIGMLSINGTVNDLAMCGARPLYLSAGFILEEGFSIENLWRIANSMKEAAEAAHVSLVTGDTKVVDRGKADGIFINTSGVGFVPPGVDIRPGRAAAGDCILINGPVAQHGISIMSVREGLQFDTPPASDCAALNGLVESMLQASGNSIHVLRDPTRGGVASVLNELAASSGKGIIIEEEKIPVTEDVRGACEILGLDPLYVANEGKLIAFVPRDQADRVLEAMRDHPLGRESVMIGEVTENHPRLVVMRTRIGGTRVVDMLSGEQLPRIC